MTWRTNLEVRRSADSGWDSAYKKNSSQAEHVAENVHIIHVSKGKPALLLREMQLDPSRASSSAEPLETEKALGWPPSLYFYAGRAFPFEGGTIAFAFNGDFEGDHKGSVTPFDSGGMRKGHIRWAPLANESDKIAYIKSSTVDLKRWRDEFEEFLASYFEPLKDYWTDRGPCRADPEGLFTQTPRNHWRAWSFEVRFHEKQDILASDFWCGRSAGTIDVERLAEDVSPLRRRDLQKFVDCGLEAFPTLDFCARMEEEELKRLGI